MVGRGRGGGYYYFTLQAVSLSASLSPHLFLSSSSFLFFRPVWRFVESPELLAPHDLPHPAVAWEWVSGDGRRSSGANGASAHQ